MKYEVCYMDSRMFILVMLYRTEQDYYKDRPAEIYVITQRRNLNLALQRLELLKMKYKEAKIELVIDKRGKDMVTPILNTCYNAKEVVSPRIW